jgi:hypothetical protein
MWYVSGCGRRLRVEQVIVRGLLLLFLRLDPVFLSRFEVEANSASPTSRGSYAWGLAICLKVFRDRRVWKVHLSKAEGDSESTATRSKLVEDRNGRSWLP